MRAVYMAVSLPDSFQFPADDRRTRLLTEAVLPACRDLNIPLSLMIGVRRQVNPALRLAGDASGRADLRSIETLCREFPDNRFLVSVLSRENQHELCVYARKFANLMPFGCWWFLNQPVDGGGNHARAPGDARDQFHPAAFRCQNPRAGDLQMAKYPPDSGSGAG